LFRFITDSVFRYAKTGNGFLWGLDGLSLRAHDVRYTNFISLFEFNATEKHK
jgi:hypothetical protein